MDRAIKPITAQIGGVEIRIGSEVRRKIRRMARQAAVIGGWVSGCAAVTCAAVAVLQSSLLWPVVVCGAVAGVVLWRCRSCR